MRSTTVRLVGGLGELLITAGAVVLLFAFWQLVWTDVTAASTQRSTLTELHQRWSAEPAGAAPPEASHPPASESDPPALRVDQEGMNAPSLPEPAAGEPFAVVHIPRFGPGWAVGAAQGVGLEQVLNEGVLGHYPGTAMPGAVGNASFAGHRTTYGKPLAQIDELVAGDPIVVETAGAWYVYRVTDTSVVTPDRVDVIAPVPGEPGAVPTRRLITLTACHPEYSARQRYIVHGELESWRPRDAGAPAALSAPVAGTQVG